MFQYNKFTKKPDSKTAFVLCEGQPIFNDSLYILSPFYIHKKSPEFTLVSKGKHISGFFKCCGGAFIGDFQKQALIVFQRELGFDLFKTNLSPAEARLKLCTGELNDQLLEAREA